MGGSKVMDKKIEQVEVYIDELMAEVEVEKENRDKGRLRKIITKDITNLKEDIAYDLKEILEG